MLNQSQVLIVCQFIVLQKKNTGLLILYVQITPGSDKLRYPVLFYHKPRKICWAKHPQFQPYEVVHDALARSVHYLKYSEVFTGKLPWPSKSFPVYSITLGWELVTCFVNTCIHFAQLFF